jgi:hypothetical protein
MGGGSPCAILHALPGRRFASQAIWLPEAHEHWRFRFGAKHIGGRFWRPPIVLPVALLTYFFFAVFLAAFFAGFFATAFLVAIFSILPFRVDIEPARDTLQLTNV